MFRYNQHCLANNPYYDTPYSMDYYCTDSAGALVNQLPDWVDELLSIIRNLPPEMVETTLKYKLPEVGKYLKQCPLVFPASGSAKSIAYSPDGTELAVGTPFNDVWIWSIQTGDLLRHLPPPSKNQLMAIAYSPDGGKLAIGTADGVSVWDMQSGLVRNSPSRAPVNSIVYSPDGRQLAGGDSIIVRIWDAQTGTVIRDLPFRWVQSVAYSPDGMQVAGGTHYIPGFFPRREAHVRIWNTPNRRNN